jgi:putative intracellular protease/amidase
MRIEIVVFEGFDALDVVAPWEVFARAASIDPVPPRITQRWKSFRDTAQP